MDPSLDHEAELRGFNLPARHRIWRDVLLPRLVIPLFWLYWLLLLPAWLIGLGAHRRHRASARRLAIESGIIGWRQVFFEELGASAEEYFGQERVSRQVIDRDQPYLPQQRANLARDLPSHLVIDVRTSGQGWRRSLIETLVSGWSVYRRGITPIVVLTDAFYRRQRWQASTLTAFRGVVVTYASAEIVRPIFPHARLIGPMIMPVSRARLGWLDDYASGLDKKGDVVQFIGHVYSPRKEFFDLVAERLAPSGIALRVNGDKWGTSNDDYWRTLADADVIVTTTMQGPDRRFMDWIWVQQAVFRFTETMAAGAALVASEVPGITRFFAPGQDFLQFVSVDEAVASIERLVHDQQFRRDTTEAGHEKASALIRSDAFWTIIDTGLGSNAVSL